LLCFMYVCLHKLLTYYSMVQFYNPILPKEKWHYPGYDGNNLSFHILKLLCSCLAYFFKKKTGLHMNLMCILEIIEMDHKSS